MLRMQRHGVLAFGAQAKSSLCFVKNGTAYVSEPDGDLSELESLKLFEDKIKKLQKNLKARPGIIACDSHPEYISTKLANEWGESQGLKVKPVQHHHAHVASCIADNDIKGEVIGIAFDGTGFGLDGNIWGGEFFTGTIKGLKRAAHLEYIPMPGGEASVKEPWRMALSYLYNIYGAGFKRLKIDFLTRLKKDKVELLTQIIDKKINSPLTSSMGRLFDGVSSLAGICDRAEYEGQAAIELEQAISNHQPLTTNHDRYSFDYKYKDKILAIDWVPVIKGVVKDLQAKRSKGEVSLKFHNAVCYMIKDVCSLLRKKYKINKVSMSGGVFQNRYLTGNIGPILEREGFKVYLHKNIPAHDGNIALGQAVLASA